VDRLAAMAGNGRHRGGRGSAAELHRHEPQLGGEDALFLLCKAAALVVWSWT
jgi:hypothetical protein